MGGLHPASISGFMASDHFRYIYWPRWYRELTDPEHAWGKGGAEEEGGEEDAWAVETTAVEPGEPEPAVAAFSDPAPAAAPLSSGPVSTEGERAFGWENPQSDFAVKKGFDQDFYMIMLPYDHASI